MKHVTFYIMEFCTPSKGLSAIELLVCDLAALHWRSGKSILIVCEDKKQANNLNEALWQNPINSFIPHNLVGEGPINSAPIEIGWPLHYGVNPHDLLINMLVKFEKFITFFHEVIDFVPYQHYLKQYARKRYKSYLSNGFQFKIVHHQNQKDI